MVGKKFQLMAQKIYINPDPKVVTSIANEYAFIQTSLAKLKAINVDGIEPFTRIAPPIHFGALRPDKPHLDHYLDKEKMLSNAAEHDADFVIIKRMLN